MVIEEIPHTNNPQHHIYKMYNTTYTILLSYYSKWHISSKSDKQPQTGLDHFFYTIQWYKIEKDLQTKVGGKTTLALCTIKKRHPKKATPVMPTSDQLIETFKGLKLKKWIGKFSKDGCRIVA
jgi:hypothetical protein